jgi:phenylalanyl-tRNA synthetase beta chain
MQERLLACGMRPINNVVDVTNYVMMEYGQPLHSFDYTRIRGQKIIVRRAFTGEVIITLDDEERMLSGDTLVIADTDRAVAIAGVMGGANSEVTQRTTMVLLESASFNPTSIHYSSHHLSLVSEASMRFERGIQPGLTIPALKHATQLIKELSGGKVARGIADVYPGKRNPQPVSLTKKETKRVLGIGFSLEQIAGTLTSLGFDCQKSDSEVQAVPPYWRSDISQPVDLIEEVARINGYDRIPTTLLGQPLPKQHPEPVIGLKKQARSRLTGYGFQEIISYSLTSLDMLNKLTSEPVLPEPPPLRVANPMTAEQEYLRPNLRASLLTALAANRRHDEGGIRLFEIGKVYLPRPKDLPAEPEILCGVLGGAKSEESWLDAKEALDFFDAKGTVESLLNHLGVAATYENSGDKGLHPSRQAAIIVASEQVGVVGELHPRVADAFEISEPVYLFELNMTELLPLAVGHRLFQPLPRFPATVRDMALIIDTATTHKQVMDIITDFPLVNEATLFDVYSGKQIPPGKKSYAYRLVYQSPEHTLTEEEVNQVQEQILDRLGKELGAALRG